MVHSINIREERKEKEGSGQRLAKLNMYLVKGMRPTPLECSGISAHT